MNPLIVKNAGPQITFTNFWKDLDRGKFLVSLNARCFRILTPRSKEAEIPQMVTAQEVIVSRGPWPAEYLKDALELLFDDGTPTPYALHLPAEAFDRVPARVDAGRTDLSALVYRCGDQGQPVVCSM